MGICQTKSNKIHTDIVMSHKKGILDDTSPSGVLSPRLNNDYTFVKRLSTCELPDVKNTDGSITLQSRDLFSKTRHLSRSISISGNETPKNGSNLSLNNMIKEVLKHYKHYINTIFDDEVLYKPYPFILSEHIYNTKERYNEHFNILYERYKDYDKDDKLITKYNKLNN